MRHWRVKALSLQDVAFFQYVAEDEEKKAEEVYVWDLDKTYLDTRVDDLKSIVKMFVERGSKRKNIPGTAFLLKTLQQQWTQKSALYFISASPPQMEDRIREKLLLDEVKPHGFFFKDNLRNLHPKRFQRLTRQLGYKLQALLQLRLRLNENVHQIMWGDDSEADAVAYCLYSDICSQRLKREEIDKILMHFKVIGSQRDLIFELQSDIKAQDPVEKIYINLEEDTDAEYYLKFGRRVLPTHNTLQIAFDLFQDKRMSLLSVLDLARRLIDVYGFTLEEIGFSLDDLVRRQVLGDPYASQIQEALKENKLLPLSFEFSTERKKVLLSEDKKVRRLEGQFEPWIVEYIDYVNDYR